MNEIFLYNNERNNNLINLDSLLHIKNCDIENKIFESDELKTKTKNSNIYLKYVNNKDKNKYYIYYNTTLNKIENEDIIDFLYYFECIKKDFNYIDIMLCDRIISRNYNQYFNTNKNGLFINHFYGFNFKIYFDSEITENEFESFKLYSRNLNENDRQELQTLILYNEKYRITYKLDNISYFRGERVEYEVDSDSDY